MKSSNSNIILLVLAALWPLILLAQEPLDFKGQASIYGNYSPDNDLDFLIGSRYIPEINYNYQLKNAKALNFEAAANINGSILFHPFDSAMANGKIKPYRLWGRYTGKQYEIRIGLQKIDFGSATMLRPLQWFNELDPRDPLSQTNGVTAALGRYYFLNNANIWLWVLYGNEDPRGFDITGSNKEIPEFGGRFQHPVPKGELGISYHHRTADSRGLPMMPAREKIREDRLGIDGKWDVEIGLWFEAAYVHKSGNLGMFTNQSFLSLGADYTFGIGNGLNVVAEHLLVNYEQEAFGFDQSSNISGCIFTYPLKLFDNISTIANYSWESRDFTFFLNYEHQFRRITSYIMAYYNPKNQNILQQSEFVNTFSGPGIRLMLVYNH